MQGGGRRAGLLLATSAMAFASALGAAETIDYSYDALGRLVRVERSGGPQSGVAASYGYDCAGNRREVLAGAGAPPAPPTPPCPAAGSPSPPSPPPPSPPPPSPPPPSPPPPGNHAPVANPDTGPAIPKCGSTSIDVAANDSDPDGPPPFAVTGLAGGAGLALTLDGNIVLIESLGPAGPKTFTYTLADGLGATATGTVAITVTQLNQCD